METVKKSNKKKNKTKNKKQMLCVFLMLTSMAFTSCGINPERLNKTSSNQTLELGDIVNGKSVKNKQEITQSIVAIMAHNDEGDALCTGTLLSENTILTAAHCVENDPQKLEIIFGINALKASDKNRRIADKYIQQPNWQKHLPSGEGDLAIIHFKEAAPKQYQPVTLATSSFKLKKAQEIILAGFGVTDGESQSGAGKLRQTTSTVIDQRSPTEFATDGEKSSVCFGDSGGPAFVKIGNQLIQWGVASSVMNRECNLASIHTAVMKYDAWIKATIKKMQK